MTDKERISKNRTKTLATEMDEGVTHPKDGKTRPNSPTSDSTKQSKGYPTLK
jgi:hypothetical protein